MSWLRIEGRMPQHAKVAPLSDAAFRLHITAMAWSVEGKTDGRIPASVPGTLTRAPRGKALKNALSELVTARVWLPLGADGYEIHDFLQWNLSATEIDSRSAAKARAGSMGGKRSWEQNGGRRSARADTPADAVVRNILPQTSAEHQPLSLPLPKSLSNPEGEQESAPALPDNWDGSDREMSCPLDLRERAVALKIDVHLAEKLRADVESVRESMREFVSYWTIGAGMGQKRRHWMRKLRESVRKEAGRPGGLKPIGAVLHGQHEANADHDSRAAVSAVERQRERWAEQDRIGAELARKGNPDV